MLIWLRYKTNNDMTEPTGKITGKHGGPRPNSGRKHKYAEETTVIRVPVSKKYYVQQLLARTASNEIPFDNRKSDLSPTLDLQRVEIRSDVKIPFMDELIVAGFPSPASDHIQDVVDLNDLLIRNKDATFMGRIGSESMLDAGFDIGDIVIIDRSITPVHKDIVIAMIDNDFTMKQLMLCKYDGSDCDDKEYIGKPFPAGQERYQQPVWFKAANPAYKNIYPLPGQTIEIIAVVTHNIKKVCRR